MCVGVLQQPQSVDLHQRILAAGAGEDRAALSGRPRKANAGQYEGVMQQRTNTKAHSRNSPQNPAQNSSCHRRGLRPGRGGVRGCVVAARAMVEMRASATGGSLDSAAASLGAA